jgi:hypothetical protein
MPRVSIYDKYTGKQMPPPWTPEVTSFSPYLTPTQSSPLHRYQTPVQRPDAMRSPRVGLQPGQQA